MGRGGRARRRACCARRLWGTGQGGTQGRVGLGGEKEARALSARAGIALLWTK